MGWLKSHSMQAGLVGSVMVVAIVAVAGYSMFHAGASSVAQSSSGPYSTVPCSSSYPLETDQKVALSNGTEVSEITSPALSMALHSTLEVCVLYSNASPSTHYEGNVTIWSVSGNETAAQGFNLAEVQKESTSGDGGRVTVEYIVNADSASSGFYKLKMTGACNSIPFAVGYPTSQIRSSDFPGFLNDGCASSGALAWLVIGYSDGTVANLTARAE